MSNVEIQAENIIYDKAKEVEQKELKNLSFNKDKTKCPRCESENVGIFPNCSYTYGCSNCGMAFVKKPKEKKKRWR